jgi:hypothetical protein
MSDGGSDNGELWVMFLLFALSLLFFLNGDMDPTGADCPGGYWAPGMRYVDVATWVCP